MSTGNHDLTKGILIALKFASLMPFIIGLIWNYDGYTILSNSNNYRAGVLKVTRLEDFGGDSRTRPSTMGLGYVDSVYTGILLTKENQGEQLNRKSESDIMYLVPVWYKPDGHLTLNRYEDEAKFPVLRIWGKVIQTLLLLIVPFIVVMVIDWRFKRKWKLKADEQKMRRLEKERYIESQPN